MLGSFLLWLNQFWLMSSCFLYFLCFYMLPFTFFSAWWCRVLMNPSLRPSGVDGPQPDVCLRKWTKQHFTTTHTIQTQPKEASTDLYITLCYKQKYLIKKLFIVVAFYVMHILPMWYIYVFMWVGYITFLLIFLHLFYFHQPQIKVKITRNINSSIHL